MGADGSAAVAELLPLPGAAAPLAPALTDVRYLVSGASPSPRLPPEPPPPPHHREKKEPRARPEKRAELLPITITPWQGDTSKHTQGLGALGFFSVFAKKIFLPGLGTKCTFWPGDL